VAAAHVVTLKPDLL